MRCSFLGKPEIRRNQIPWTRCPSRTLDKSWTRYSRPSEYCGITRSSESPDVSGTARRPRMDLR
eukprot:2217954-Amphidinium_carterae.1